uniref:transposase n=1 Tax=Marinisporobacter balticus TaxID=2018667 RepID=UPI0038CC151E
MSCKHRHLVFTIPKELRIIFRKDRTLLNLLFRAAADTLLSWFNNLNKSQNFKPGIISVLHTFGRDLKFNPHIHILCTEGAMGNTQVFRPVKYINYESLRKRFQTILLNMLEFHFGKDNFRSLKNKIYAKTKNGFYVRAKRGGWVKTPI